MRPKFPVLPPSVSDSASSVSPLTKCVKCFIRHMLCVVPQGFPTSSLHVGPQYWYRLLVKITISNKNFTMTASNNCIPKSLRHLMYIQYYVEPLLNVIIASDRAVCGGITTITV